MTLVLENPEVERMAGELARLERLSPAEVVELALRERHRRVADDLAERDRKARELLERIWASPVYDDRAPDDILYDENGDPK